MKAVTAKLAVTRPFGSRTPHRRAGDYEVVVGRYSLDARPPRTKLAIR